MMPFRTLLLDLRLAARTLRRSPVFSTIVIVSLALALGLNSTLFAILDAVANPVSALRRPDQLFVVGMAYGNPRLRPPPEQFRAIVDSSVTSFRGTTIAQSTSAAIRAGALPERMERVAWVDANFFELLGIRPRLGRAFIIGGSNAGDDVGAVVSSALWQRAYTGRRSLAGATVTVNQQTFPIIGVTPRGTTWPWGADVWLPRSLASHEYMPSQALLVARMAPAATMDGANTELATLASRLNFAFGAAVRPLRIIARPIDPWANQSPGDRLSNRDWQMLAAVGAVLLIACVNLANLMLARGAERRRSLAIRAAIGASRAALVRVQLAECLLLGLASGVAGVLTAVWAKDAVLALMPGTVRGFGVLYPVVSWRLFAFGLGIAMLSVLLFGLVPAWRSSRVDPGEALQDGAGTTRATSRSRFGVLVVAQIGLSLTLIMAAGLLMRSVRNIADFEFGFDPWRITTARVALDSLDAPTRDAAAALSNNLLERVRELPGAQAVAVGARGELDGRTLSFEQEGVGVRDYYLSGSYMDVTPGYFDVLGLRTIDGQLPPDDGAATAPAVVVDSVMAVKFWGPDNPIGRMVKFGTARSDSGWHRVVGVVEPIRMNMSSLNLEPQGMIFLVKGRISTPYQQLFVRSSRELAPRMSDALRATITTALPSSPSRLLLVQRLSYEADEEIGAQTFLSRVVAVFAGSALLLSAIGLYGVLSAGVERRRREFGVRLALGARPADVMRLIIGESTVLVVGGIAVGAFVAMAAARYLDDVLFGVPFSDAVTLVLAEAILLLTCALAALWPARRAAQTDPLEVMRAD
jgi:predicted permease